MFKLYESTPTCTAKTAQEEGTFTAKVGDGGDGVETGDEATGKIPHGGDRDQGAIADGEVVN